MSIKNTVYLWAAVLTVSAGGAFAQVKKKPAAAAHKATRTTAKPAVARAQLLPTDPDVLIGKLPNGLTYYIRRNAQPQKRAYLSLVLKVGSINETDAQQGMAEFVQHMAFKGTRDFPKDVLTKYLDKTNMKYGPDQSAFTSYDETAYRLALPTDSGKMLADGFNLLANWAAYTTFDPADVADEKKVVAELSRNGGNSAQDRILEKNSAILLANSKYAQHPPQGKEAAINTFTAATARSFYSDWYRPDLEAVIAIGDFDPQQVADLIKFNFSSLRNPTPEKPAVQYNVPIAPGTSIKFVTEKDFPYTLMQTVVRHPQTVVKTTDDFFRNMQVTLFNQMLDARITELTQSENSPILYGQALFGAFSGHLDAFTAVGVAKNTAGLENTVKAVTAETELVRRFGFTTTELERAKQAAIGQISSSYKTKDNVASANFIGEYERNFLTGQAIPGIDYEYNYYLSNIGKITTADMLALSARLVTDQNRVIIIEASDADKDKLPNEQTITTWMADVGKGLKPYVDDFNNEPLMAQPPQGDKITSIKVDSVLQVANLTLSNGVKVILKPTKTNNDQILINGYSFGGTSLADEQDFTSASLASQVVGNSGVAGFNQTVLKKLLRGKSLSITSYVGDITQGVSGYASTADFETAMQLVYLYFTSPRKDPDVWNATVNQLKSMIARKGTDPGSVLQDTVLAVINNYNPRAMPVTAEKLDAASLDKAYNFYKARFADASNFTFTFTGNFTLESIAPYLISYLSSLPSSNTKETYKVLGIHPPSGQVTKTIYQGTSDKATVDLIYSGPYEYNEANNIQMDALEDILNTRLSDSIKKESGVLTASVRASYVKIPESRYRITISYLCDAKNVDQTIDYIQGEINKIKQYGAYPHDIDLFANREALSTQGQMRQNAYWQANLSAAAQNDENPDRILNHIQDIGLITTATTKDAANKYLNNANFIKIILLPEKK